MTKEERLDHDRKALLPAYDTRAFCVDCGRLYKLPRKWWDAIDDHACVCGEGVLELVEDKT